jgi:hypothetical protein
MGRARVDREKVLEEIRRCAAENGGQPLGRGRFEEETGIREADWLGRYWARWSDAVEEAGLAPNTLQGAYSDDELLRSLASLVRELGHFPTAPELKMRRLRDSTFPSSKVFERLGSKTRRVARLVDYCDTDPAFADVRAICALLVVADEEEGGDDEVDSVSSGGYVYLLKSGRHYKIGWTGDLGRRTYDLRLQLPEKAVLVHAFETDDPVGIEAYWHQRFEHRHTNGEWFLLSKADVAAFKQRKQFM